MLRAGAAHSLIVSIHQPHFLPWLGYWNKVLRSNVFVLLDSVQYRKNYFQNRTLIKNLDGKPLWLTLPVHAKLGTPIAQVTIAEENWQVRIAKTVEQCYRRAPFFEPCWPGIRDALSGESTNLAEVNARAFRAVLDLLGGGVRVERIGDLPVHASEPTERLVEACAALGATRYIAGRGGRNYLRPEAFEKAGIEVVWQSFDPANAVYEQGSGEFVPGLSVLDCLFHVGPSRARQVIDGAWAP